MFSVFSEDPFEFRTAPHDENKVNVIWNIFIGITVVVEKSSRTVYESPESEWFWKTLKQWIADNHYYP